MATLNIEPARLDLTGIVGDDITLTVTCVDSDDAAVDVSSYTIVATVIRGEATVETFTDSVSGAGSNIITLSLTDTQTTTIGSLGAFWSLSMTTGSDTRQWLSGRFRLYPLGEGGVTADTSATLTVDTGTAATLTAAVSSSAAGDLLSTNNLSDVASAATSRTNLGLAIGSDVQAWSAALDAVSGTNTGDEAAADLTTAGVVELATIAETDTGTDATRAVTPAGLAGSALQTKVDGIEAGATADQTGAQIKVAYEAEADTNAFTDADHSKLDGIEAGADVVDATNVASAGAVMDADISEGEGLLRKTGAGAYEAIKTNLGASVAPTTTDDTNAGYAVGSVWIDTTADKAYVALDVTASAAVWTETTVTGAGTVDTSGTPVATDFARFTDADTIEGRSPAEARADLSLEVGTDVQAWSAVLDATTASFLTADETKLDGIAASATANPNAIDNVVEDTTPQLGGDLDAQGNQITDAGAIESDTTSADVVTTYAIDCSTTSRFDLTMTGDTTFSFTNPAPSGKESVITLNLAGAFTPTFPGAVSWIGSTPTYADSTIYVFATVDAGTTWEGSVVGGAGHASVTLAGTPDYLTISGQEITRGLIDLTADVTGDLPVAEGGTAASDAATARTNLGVAIGSDVQAWAAVLDATTASFLTADETKLDGIETAADVTDATNVGAAGAVMDTLADAKGDLIAATAADTWARLAVGTDGDVLTADAAEASGVKWSTTAAAADEVVLEIRNDSGATLDIGDPVYITGWNVGQSLITVDLADADDATKMPALGIVKESISTASNGRIVLSGIVSGFDTSAWATGDGLWVSTTAGTLTNTRPEGAAAVQKVGTVLRDHASLGSMMVTGANRTNDVPNFLATEQSGTTYTIDGDDDGTTVIATNAAQVTVTIPTDASDDLRLGYKVTIFAAGAGGVTTTTTSLTLKGSSPNTTIAQNEAIYYEKTGADTWMIIGGTAA